MNATVLDAIASASLRTLSDFTPQDFANLAWSYSKLGVRNNPLSAAISSCAIKHISDFVVIPSHLAMTAWAFATLGIRDHPLLNAIASEALLPISVFEPMDLGNIAWSCAKLAFGHSTLMDALA